MTGNGAFKFDIMANETDNFTNEFMKKLREQTALTQRRLTREDEDRKIMNTVAKWWRDENDAYQHFLDNGRGYPKTEVEYFAHHIKKGGIGLKEGWEFTKKTLRGRFDIESLEDGEDFHQEFIDEFHRTPYSQKFREKIVNYGIK